MAKLEVVVAEHFGERATQVYNVLEKGSPGSVAVWWDGRPRCCECSGPLSAMSGSCRHAAAVRRYVKKEPRHD